MKKLSIVQIISFLFPLILWGYFLFAPNIQSEQLLIQKNILGAKFSSQSIWVEAPFLAEKINQFFSAKPYENF